jgi:hypothetical protein
MSEGPYSDPSGQNPPTSDGTWQAPPPYVPPYQATPPTQPYPTTPPAEPYGSTPPTQPYGSTPPADPYAPQPAVDPYGTPAPYQPGQAYPPQSPYGTAPTYPGYAQGTQWQAVPQQPRRRTGLIIGIVVAVVLVLCVGGLVAVGLSGSGDDKTSGTKAPNLTPTKSAAPVVAAIALGDGAALKAHLAKPTAGAKTFTIDNSSSGVETLDQFVKNSFPDSPDEKGILQTRGFEVVAENNWRGTDGVSVNTQLIQFANVDGAVGHVLGQHGAYADDTTVTNTYALAGLSNGWGYERPTLDEYGNRAAILTCNMGNIVIVMFIFTPGQLDRAAELADMQRQVAALAP